MSRMPAASTTARTAPPVPSAITVPVEKKVLSSDVVIRGTVRYGALAAAAAGVLVLLALAPAWPQFRALILAAEGSAAAALLASRFDGVQKLTGSLGTREGEGVVVLLGLVAISLGIAALAAHECRAERAGRHDTGLLPIPRRLAPAIAAGGFAVIAIGTFALAGGRDQGGRERPAGFGARSDRLVSLQSNRYDYWRVARREFARRVVIRSRRWRTTTSGVLSPSPERGSRIIRRGWCAIAITPASRAAMCGARSVPRSTSSSGTSDRR